jgi:hypothetical protein
MLPNPVVPTYAFVFLFGEDHRSPQNCRDLGSGGLEERVSLPFRLPKFPSRSMMLGDVIPWLLLVVAACHAAVLPSNPPSTDNSARWPNFGGGGGVGPLRKPVYVRMPVSRHHFNGTKRSPGGRHSPPRSPHDFGPSSKTTTAQSVAQREYQNDRRWGWSALEELGGIAYIMQCVPHYPSLPLS